MKFWLISFALYAGFLATQLLLPVAALWNRQGLDALAIGLYVLTAVAICFATALACLMAAKALFPQYWWMGQILGQDIFEFDGVYFLGLRLSRVPSRLQRLLFGADERFRWWDMMFGLMFLVLLVPHVLATVTAYRRADLVLPRRIQFPETLHAATLSALPLLQEWQAGWSTGPVLAARLARESETLHAKGGKTDADWFRLAQVEMLLAFHPRRSVTEPYAFSPADRIYFDRGQGARATTIARNFTTDFTGSGQPYRVDALVLIGFFHLSDYNFRKAAPLFRDALDAVAQGAPSGLPRPLITLLAAHSAALAGDTAAARRLAEAQVADETLSPLFQALTLEHLADTLRQQEHPAAAQEFLDKALALYRKQKDPMGIARIYMYRAAIHLDRGQLTAASQEISQAASQVTEVDDLFTLNMVERITHLLPAVG
jgi:hypothetical protein